jgi:hypothetical protein
MTGERMTLSGDKKSVIRARIAAALPVFHFRRIETLFYLMRGATRLRNTRTRKAFSYLLTGFSGSATASLLELDDNVSSRKTHSEKSRLWFHAEATLVRGEGDGPVGGCTRRDRRCAARGWPAAAVPAAAVAR